MLKHDRRGWHQVKTRPNIYLLRQPNLGPVHRFADFTAAAILLGAAETIS